MTITKSCPDALLIIFLYFKRLSNDIKNAISVKRVFIHYKNFKSGTLTTKGTSKEITISFIFKVPIDDSNIQNFLRE